MRLSSSFKGRIGPHLWRHSLRYRSKAAMGVDLDRGQYRRRRGVFDFLQYTGLDFAQLSTLLTLVSINGPGPTTADSSVIVFPDGNNNCDTRKMYITNLLKDSYLSTSTHLFVIPPVEVKLSRLDAINRF